MNPEFLAPLIPISAIIMFGLVKIARIMSSGGSSPSLETTKKIEERLAAIEQELAALQGEVNEAQERLDFAERMLAQSREGKRLGSGE
jgi:chromosome segregation ATPase